MAKKKKSAKPKRRPTLYLVVGTVNDRWIGVLSESKAKARLDCDGIWSNEHIVTIPGGPIE